MNALNFRVGPIRFFPLLLGAGLLIVMLWILMWLERLEAPSFEKQTIRTIDLDAPPPLPPPPEEPQPMKQYTNPDPTIDLTSMGTGPNVKFSIKPSITSAKINELPKPDVKIDIDRIHTEFESSFPTFDVEQLDKVPRVVKSRNSRIPKPLIRKGIKKVETRIEILIDQTGKAHIKKIIDAGYAEMIPVIREHINAIKFSTPTKNGKPVNAVYLFKLKFREML